MSQPNIQCPNGCGKLRADLREDDECIWLDMVCDGCGYVFGLESIPNPKAFKLTERNMQDAFLVAQDANLQIRPLDDSPSSPFPAPANGLG